jgi:hypothetical protein
MATVRELIAKLGFEVDTSGADEFQKKINGLKQGLGTLFTAKVLKGATNLEDSFLESQRKIKFLAGAQGLGLLDEALKTTSKTASQIDIAEAIRAGLERTTDPEFVKRMAEFGGLYADAFGGTMQDRTRELLEGAFSGDFGGLVAAGLFTQQEAEFLKGANINTVQGKLTLIAKLEEKRADLLKAQAEALKTADVQTSRLARNVQNFGRMIGSFLSPIIGGLLDVVNDVFEFFLGSPMAKALAKIVAFGGAIFSVVSSLKLIGFIFKKIGFGISSAIGLVARFAGWFVTLGLLANDFFKFLTGENLLKPFQVILDAIPQVIAAFEKMGAFFGGKIGEKFSGLIESIGNIDFGAIFGVEAQAQPALAMAGGGGQTIDNRKAEISIVTQNGNPEEIKAAVNGALKDSGFSRATSRARDEIAARDTQRIGANAQ